MPNADPEEEATARATCRQRVRELAGRRPGDAPIVMLTAYDAISAAIAQEAGVDVILVGDSAATTVLGYASTREVSVAEMLMLTRAVRRGAPSCCLIGDLPFASYEASDDQAATTARLFVEAGADFVKLEGASAITSRLGAIVRAGIPTVAHVGLLPQGARTADELRARGRTAAEAMQIVRDAVELERAGASMIVVEAVPSVVASAVAARVRVPVIGIGAGAHVGGQVLVYPDLLGLTPGKLPRFVRRYVDLRSPWRGAIEAFARDVRARTFPSAAEEYGMSDHETGSFEQLVLALPVTSLVSD